MSRVLVIGATGYIGARLSYLLAKSGHSVTALCYPKTLDDKEWLSYMEEIIIGDITSEKVLNKITNQYYDIAIHLVSLDHHDSNKQPTFVNSINVLPVWNLLEMFKVKETLKKFIYFSTIHVYGKFPNKIINESERTNPISPYGLTHLMAENVCSMYNQTSEIRCLNARLSNSYGSPFFKENNCWWLVVNDLCNMAFNDGEIVLTSDGSALRDFIHYQDVFNAIQKLIIESNDKREDNVFHISSGKTHSIFQLAELVKKTYYSRFNKEIQIELPMILKSKQNEFKGNYIINNQKILKLGFKQEIGLETGINELFDYLESK
jgi:UDP-glucose 4-epimerase